MSRTPSSTCRNPQARSRALRPRSFRSRPSSRTARCLWDADTKVGAVVDPGGDLDRIAGAIEEVGVKIEKILLTHGHIDHAGGAEDLRESLGVPDRGPAPGGPLSSRQSREAGPRLRHRGEAGDAGSLARGGRCRDRRRPPLRGAALSGPFAGLGRDGQPRAEIRAHGRRAVPGLDRPHRLSRTAITTR